LDEATLEDDSNRSIMQPSTIQPSNGKVIDEEIFVLTDEVSDEQED